MLNLNVKEGDLLLLIISKHCCSAHESTDDSWDVKFLQMRVFLANTYEDYGFASGVDHVKSSAHFFIDSVELSHDDTVNSAGVSVLHCEINERLVEFS